MKRRRKDQRSRRDSTRWVTEASAPLGSGERFKKLKGQLAKRGVKNPDALAAAIGRKKYGKKKFQQLAQKDEKRGGK